jgi:hypothetical protein
MELVNRLWNPDGGAAEWLRLIDFINPGRKAIKEVLAQAKAKAPNGEFPAYAPPDGWTRCLRSKKKPSVSVLTTSLGQNLDQSAWIRNERNARDLSTFSMQLLLRPHILLKPVHCKLIDSFHRVSHKELRLSQDLRCTQRPDA